MASSLARYWGNAWKLGWKEYYRNLMYIGDAKVGTHVGTDLYGNKYFENLNPEEEVPGRHRWVDFVQHDFNASQVPPEWHSWLSHTRKNPPDADTIMQGAKQPWQQPYNENLTGTRGAYKSYNTAAQKLYAWEPKVAPRKSA